MRVRWWNGGPERREIATPASLTRVKKNAAGRREKRKRKIKLESGLYPRAGVLYPVMLKKLLLKNPRKGKPLHHYHHLQLNGQLGLHHPLPDEPGTLYLRNPRSETERRRLRKVLRKAS